jgi:hypothetical protein
MSSKGYVQIHEDSDIAVVHPKIAAFGVSGGRFGRDSRSKLERRTAMEEDILKPDWKQGVTIEMKEDWSVLEYSDAHSESLDTHLSILNSPTIRFAITYALSSPISYPLESIRLSSPNRKYLRNSPGLYSNCRCLHLLPHRGFRIRAASKCLLMERCRLHSLVLSHHRDPPYTAILATAGAFRYCNCHCMDKHAKSGVSDSAARVAAFLATRCHYPRYV